MWGRWLRRLAIVVVIASLLILACAVSMVVGARATSPGEIFPGLIGGLRYATGAAELTGAEGDHITILLGTHRIPRTFLALIAGVALGAAGALIQGFTRNPLAEPGILGIAAGAAVAIAGGISLGAVSTATDFVVPALIGAVAVTALVFVLATAGPTGSSPLAFILSGMALSALLMAIVNALVITDDSVLDALRTWATGSVAGRDFSVVRAALPLCIVGGIAACLLGPAMNILALGEETAHSLGAPVQAYRICGVIVIAVLSAAAVVAAGPVSFVGLAAPHMARVITGHDYRALIPLSMLVGGFFTLTADILGRVLVAPSELPMGAVLALCGVPVFVVLVRRGRVGGLI
ncbi:FecCD family ABC transporter permease [Corynebacterium renale]|nr:iron ABC transporter permease [Corynebacterium renale]SQI21129.1 iron ABC transport system permease [Corynebacterium renale]